MFFSMWKEGHSKCSGNVEQGRFALVLTVLQTNLTEGRELITMWLSPLKHDYIKCQTYLTDE